jgi:serine/threonine protein kinase
MIADFGLSEYSAEIKPIPLPLGLPEYIDPQCFIKKDYKRNEKSDIYSLGVLFWMISSGRNPFSEIPIIVIGLKIVEGVREKPIKGTPLEYQQVYENCWKEEPYQRPDIDEIHRILNQLKLQFNNNGLIQRLEPSYVQELQRNI